jgi:predicted transcriptional regulator
MPEIRQTEILDFIQSHPNCSSGEIHKEFTASISYATVKRIISQLLTEKYIISEGKGKGTKYFISPSYELLYSIDLDSYYQKEIDEREIKEDFNLGIFELLHKSEILTKMVQSLIV